MTAKTKKISISIPANTLERLRTSAEHVHARSLSAYISQLVEEKEDAQTYSQYIDSLEYTTEETVWADGVLNRA